MSKQLAIYKYVPNFRGVPFRTALSITNSRGEVVARIRFLGKKFEVLSPIWEEKRGEFSSLKEAINSVKA